MKRFLREILPPGVLLAGSAIGVLLVAGAALIFFLLRPDSPTAPVSTAQMLVMPAPSYTPPLPTAPPTPEPTATSEVPPTPPPADVQIGQLVQISGTGVDGLRLRSEPGLAGKIMFVAIEAEVFQVTAGPNQVDGYIWWYLTSPYQQDYKGWAVSNYLAPSQQAP